MVLLKKLTKKSRQAGFTLIELLIVVAILGILAAIGIPQYQGYQTQAKLNSTKAEYTEMVKLLGGEFAKCSAGSTNMLENSTQQIACNSTNAAVLTNFIAYGNATSKNPYDSTVPAYISSGTAADGQTLVTAAAGSNGAFTVTTTYVGGTSGPTVINRE